MKKSLTTGAAILATLSLQANAFEAYIKTIIKPTEFEKIEEIRKFKKDRTFIYRTNDEIKIAIFHGSHDNIVVAKEDIRSTTFELNFEDINECYQLANIFPSSFEKSDIKKDLQTYLQLINAGINPTVRIAGVLYPNASKDFKTSTEAKVHMKIITDYFATHFNVKVSSRWSDNSGDVLGKKGVPGFNILAQNELIDETTTLFLDKQYYHNHYNLFTITFNDDNTFAIESGEKAPSPEFQEMITNYGNLRNELIGQIAITATIETKSEETKSTVNEKSNSSTTEIITDTTTTTITKTHIEGTVDNGKIETKQPTLSKTQQKKLEKAAKREAATTKK